LIFFIIYYLGVIKLANTAQAKKRANQAIKRHQNNMSNKSRLRTYIKKVFKAVASRDQTQAQAAYQAAVPIIDSMVNKGLIHKNKAARHKKRLNMHVHAMQANS